MRDLYTFAYDRQKRELEIQQPPELGPYPFPRRKSKFFIGALLVHCMTLIEINPKLNRLDDLQLEESEYQKWFFVILDIQIFSK
ncbi:hypothetical protein [Candidatus Coxiella mudrowiae]|uniref:hypothetical protein n=1 Tax=Candidatus Coxiella mudrowiae TaxID=2054173 RepID=UPI000C285934|nr:hypothetical protein [Candidatus Coxiella mudrowiae]